MTLLNNKKSILYSLIGAGIMHLYNDVSNLAAFFGLWLFFFVFIELFRSFGKRLPIRILFLFFMSFQLLFTSYLAYFVYPDYQYYTMKVEPERYFTYTISAILCFGVGLYWKEAKHQEIEVIKVSDIRTMALSNPGIAYFFLGIGIVCSFAGSVFSGAGVAFVLYVLSLLKFVGLFLVILGGIQIKRWLIFLIYGSIIITSFKEAMFHDLIIWSIFLFSTLALKFKPKLKVKLAIFLTGIFAVLFLQLIKAKYRENLQGSDASVEIVINTTKQVRGESGGLFTVSNIAPQISRFNQGWIVASVMDNVPTNVPFAEGETIRQYLEAAFLPRAWAPNKLKAGDKEIFSKYAGRKIQEGTSMALSSVSDAYINYGEAGGWVFMFVYGFLISQLMNFMSRKTREYPFLPLFALVIFAYAIRIECEMQTVMGHIVKSSLILWVIFTVYQRMLRRYFEPAKKTIPSALSASAHDLHPL